MKNTQIVFTFDGRSYRWDSLTGGLNSDGNPKPLIENMTKGKNLDGRKNKRELLHVCVYNMRNILKKTNNMRDNVFRINRFLNIFKFFSSTKAFSTCHVVLKK